MKRLHVFKTAYGENIMAEFMSAPEGGPIYLRRPIKIVQQLQLTPAGMNTAMIPMLYFPFGEQQTYAFSPALFVAIVEASDFESRWYHNSLQILYRDEIKRMLVTSAMFDDVQYDDKLIMSAPEMIQ